MMILQLDSSGQPEKWISWQLAVTYHAKGLVAWSLGHQEKIVRGGFNRVTSSESVIKTSSIMAIKGRSISNRKFRSPPLSNRELFIRDDHRCAYCGQQFKYAKLSRDHIHPTSRGGKDEWKNVITACIPCNIDKDDRTPEEANMPLLFMPFVPSRPEYLVMLNRRMLDEQRHFLFDFIAEDSRIRKLATNAQETRENG